MRRDPTSKSSADNLSCWRCFSWEMSPQNIHMDLRISWGYSFELEPLMSSRPCTGRALCFSSSITPATVLSIPFFTATGLAPDVTARRPRLIRSRASTQAVVVPSPAESLVLLATWIHPSTQMDWFYNCAASKKATNIKCQEIQHQS